MSTEQTNKSRLDEVMEEASVALVERRYFDAERLAHEALLKAHAAGDYGRMARILMPLQEARRQKRDLAVDSGVVCVVDGEVPAGKALQPGCYLVCPPRVGVDGRALREAADRKKTPVVVVVREPQTREGLWPIVAVGPVTVRTKVKPPEKRAARTRPGKKKTTRKAKPATDVLAAEPPPAPEWFVDANESLGDAAIATVPADSPASVRVEALLDRLEAVPDHEKLHQRLEEAARDAAREPIKIPKSKPPMCDDDREGNDW